MGCQKSLKKRQKKKHFSKKFENFTAQSYVRSAMKKLVILIILLSAATFLYSQENSIRSQKFYNKKALEFKDWLHITHLDSLFLLDTILKSRNLVSFRFTTSQNGEVFKSSWKQTEKEFWNINKEHFHIYLMDKITFQFCLAEKSTEIIITNQESTPFFIKIYFDENGEIQLTDNFKSSLGSGEFAIRIKNLKNLNAAKTTNLEGKEILAISQEIQKFFISYYKNKGDIIEMADLQDKSDFSTDLTFKINKLKNEVIDEGYFEYHYIRIFLVQDGTNINIKWKFQGKFSSGVFFPPRRAKDYKDLEINYLNEVNEYESALFLKLKNFLLI